MWCNVILFIMLYKVVLTFKSVNEALEYVTSPMKATEQYFHVVLFSLLYIITKSMRAF